MNLNNIDKLITKEAKEAYRTLLRFWLYSLPLFFAVLMLLHFTAEMHIYHTLSLAIYIIVTFIFVLGVQYFLHRRDLSTKMMLIFYVSGITYPLFAPLFVFFITDVYAPDFAVSIMNHTIPSLFLIMTMATAFSFSFRVAIFGGFISSSLFSVCFFYLQSEYPLGLGERQQVMGLTYFIEINLYIKEIRKVNDSGKGRPPFDEILMFKVLILQSLHNVSDDRMEFLIQDRLSFMRFLGFQTDKAVFPDAKTIWLFKEQLKEKKIIEKLFYRFNKMISKSGFTLNSGNIVDATIVQVPKQRNSKDENDQIKEGNIPEDWKKSPNKLSQKDTEARWIKKNGVNSYGYKNHILADMKTKLIKDYNISSANIYDG
jgi:transposase